MNRFYIIALSILAAALLMGCGTTPQSQRYLLAPVSVSELDVSDLDQLKVVIGQVEVAPYLAGAGLVQLGEGMTIHQAHYHRWAEPLPSQLQRQLRTGLQQQMPGLSWLPMQGSAHLRSLDYRLDVTVDNFHLDQQGQALVSGQWQLRDAEQGYIAHGAFDQQQALSEDGYPAMVAALHDAWQASLVEVGEGLSAALRQRQR